MENKNLLKQAEKTAQIHLQEEQQQTKTTTQSVQETEQHSAHQYLLQKHGEKAEGLGFNAIEAQPEGAMAEYANQDYLQNLSGYAGRIAAYVLKNGNLPEAELAEIQKQEALLQKETQRSGDIQ